MYKTEELLVMLSRQFYYKPIELRRILEGFKNLEDVLAAPKDAFLKLGIYGKALDGFLEARKKENNKTSQRPYPLYSRGDLSSFSSPYIRGGEEGLKIATILDENYPSALKNLHDAPPILFYKGEIGTLGVGTGRPTSQKLRGTGDLSLRKNIVAVIGSRKMTDYGKRATEFFVKQLCRNFVIVSGLAYGIDGLAHEITVKNGGKTVAILGSGLDQASIYPKANARLAEKIVETNGLLLSEVPPGVGPQKFHFPMRNRLIAALSRGILIVEGGKKSGTLITAKLGLEMGADIFAVPNNIFHSNSEGVNFLIKYGAHIATEPQDILSFYGIEAEKKPEYAPKNDLEKNILNNLKEGEKTLDELLILTKTTFIALMETITELEIEGAIKNIGGQKYMRI